MNFPAHLVHNFQFSGNVTLTACPVCGNGLFSEIWRLPQNRLEKTAVLDSPGAPYHGYQINYLPTLRVPQEIYVFDICHRCESIFLNPKNDDQMVYRSDTSKVKYFKEHGLDGFRYFTNSVRKLFPANTKKVVDSACGSGQVLALLKELDPGLELMGLELSQPSVDFINHELGIKACAVDLDQDDLDQVVPPGTIDFVILSEAFEHVRRPLTVMRKMVRLLRPGGRVHFTAQYYGDNSLQIRVDEPIYINQQGFEYVIGELGVKLVNLIKDNKIRATIEKPA